ncbi:hypothetical protein FRC02_004294 [Tulasnella sp. 418]|nr:hypothetical protein FRC02_004294 [Tulasnella sp. 418]
MSASSATSPGRLARAASSTSPVEPPTRIPLEIVDAPTQRRYALAGVLMIQAMKIHDFFFTPSWPPLLKWIFIDALWISLLPLLRIPRLTFKLSSRILLILIFALFNTAIFANYHVSITLTSFLPKSFLGFGDEGREISTAERHVRIQDLVDRGGHLIGQHTVRLSPISTAELNPSRVSYCLSPPHNEVLVPILLNNSRPTTIQYSISALGKKSAKHTLTLNSREITKLDKEFREHYHIMQVSSSSVDDSEPYDDEYENDEYDINSHKYQAKRIQDQTNPHASHRRLLSSQQQQFYQLPLQSTQSITHLRINRPGTIRLERLISDKAGVRIIPNEVMVVECPTAEFQKADINRKECSGVTRELFIQAKGVTPLKVKWHREINGKRENFVIEGIEGSPEVSNVPVAEDVKVPIKLSLDAVGKHRYFIDSLVDGLGNVFDPSMLPQTSLTSRSVEVISRSSATFKNCGSGKTVSLFKGSEARLSLALNGNSDVRQPRIAQPQAFDNVKSVTIQYEPSIGSKKAAFVKQYDYQKGKNDQLMDIAVSNQGVYTILGVQGDHCSGDVLSPESCRVVERPEPTADVDLRSIHECSGDVGVKASLVLHGSPPFTIYYTEQRNKEPLKRLHRIVPSARDEIILQPESSGTYTYEFTHISDKNYNQIPLKGDGLGITQVVHPLASAEFVKHHGGAAAGRKQILNSCSGSEVDVDVDLRGIAPWTLEFQVVSPSGTRVFTVPNLTNSRSRVSVEIPKDVDAEGGTFQVDLVSIVDANGCKRSLSVPGISVNVQRVKPTAKFYSNDGLRKVTILQGNSAELPLRLTGEPPWQISYRVDNDSQVKTTHLRSPNGQLQVKESGVYELVNVHDAHCPGSVVSNESKYTVEWVQKPAIQFTEKSGILAKNNSLVRKPVCEGEEDWAELRLHGRPPFQISYIYSADLENSERTRDLVTFNSIQNAARIPLRTLKGGHHRYHIAGVGDASYPIPREAQSSSTAVGVPIVRGRYLEQSVLVRPSAHFKSTTRVSHCLNDAFVPTSRDTDEALVVLRGHPPFHLTLSIKNLATNEDAKQSVTIYSTEWRVDLPHYRFSSVGPTLVTIESVKDSSPCEEAQVDLTKRSIWVDVAETAAIVPFDRRQEFCIGEVMSFQLEGTPPWTIRYTFNNRITDAKSKSPKFSRVAEEPGVFKILSIAHQQNQCQTVVRDVEMTVKPIPSARVSNGKRVIQDIREGDQAEIVFDLVGTPPFTFTYQRTELPGPGTKGKALKVMESHTVSGVTTKEYSIFSAQEGTWTVTFISDRYCRYPPNPPDNSIEKA